MNIKEEERRARLLKSRAERLPDIKRQFEESQKRNFNSNFGPGGKDEKLVKKPAKKVAKSSTKADKKTAPAKSKAKNVIFIGRRYFTSETASQREEELP